MAEEKKQQDKLCPECVKEIDEGKPVTLELWISSKLKDHSCVFIRVRGLYLDRINMGTFVGPDQLIADVKIQVMRIFGVSSRLLLIYYRGHILQDRRTFKSYGIFKGATIDDLIPLKGGGLSGVKYDEQKQALIVGGDQYGTQSFEIPSFHVSCRSDKITGEDMVGVVLYKYDNKIDWHLNGMHCKSGYILLKLSKNVQHIKGEPGIVHGACYKSVFGVSLDIKKVIGGGFAYFNGKWKFNSFTFNTGDEYHDNKKAMHPMEEKCIKAAIENWKNGTQNTSIKDISAKYENNRCGKHGFY